MRHVRCVKKCSIHLFRDNQRQFTDLHNDLADALNIVFGGKVHDGPAHLPYNAYLMHGRSLLSEADLLCGDGPQTHGHIAGNTGKGLEIGGAHIVGDLLQVDGVKLALGGADAAAYAHVFIHGHRAARAARRSRTGAGGRSPRWWRRPWRYRCPYGGYTPRAGSSRSRRQSIPPRFRGKTP